MQIVIRKMEFHEASAVKKVEKRAFAGGIEKIFASKPKEAMVATIDDKIVGGIIIKYSMTKKKKLGYIDMAFIDPDYHNKGIGKLLYEKADAYLWEQGCNALSATVKDDNVGSWKIFLNNGYSQVSICEEIRQLGFLPTLKHYFTTPFFVANGMEWYLNVKNQKLTPKKPNSILQIFLFLLVNFLLIMTVVVRKPSDLVAYVSAYILLLVGCVIFGVLGTLFTKRQWHFRLNSGGAVMVAFVTMIGGIYPMIGRWYPKVYENTKAFRKDMGIVSLFQWIFLLCLSVALYIVNFYLEPNFFIHYLSQFTSMLLLYHVLAFYPFEIYGGKRVYLWNKALFIVLSAFSIALFVLSMFF